MIRATLTVAACAGLGILVAAPASADTTVTCSPEPCYVRTGNFAGDTATNWGLLPQRTANGWANMPSNTAAGWNDNVSATIGNYSNNASATIGTINNITHSLAGGGG
jgi:hypothetical protein